MTVLHRTRGNCKRQHESERIALAAAVAAKSPVGTTEAQAVEVSLRQIDTTDHRPVSIAVTQIAHVIMSMTVMDTVFPAVMDVDEMRTGKLSVRRLRDAMTRHRCMFALPFLALPPGCQADRLNADVPMTVTPMNVAGVDETLRRRLDPSNASKVEGAIFLAAILLLLSPLVDYLLAKCPAGRTSTTTVAVTLCNRERVVQAAATQKLLTTTVIVTKKFAEAIVAAMAVRRLA